VLFAKTFKLLLFYYFKKKKKRKPYSRQIQNYFISGRQFFVLRWQYDTIIICARLHKEMDSLLFSGGCQCLWIIERLVCRPVFIWNRESRSFVSQNLMVMAGPLCFEKDVNQVRALSILCSLLQIKFTRNLKCVMVQPSKDLNPLARWYWTGHRN